MSLIKITHYYPALKTPQTPSKKSFEHSRFFYYWKILSNKTAKEFVGPEGPLANERVGIATIGDDLNEVPFDPFVLEGIILMNRTSAEAHSAGAQAMRGVWFNRRVILSHF